MKKYLFIFAITSCGQQDPQSQNLASNEQPASERMNVPVAGKCKLNFAQSWIPAGSKDLNDIKTILYKKENIGVQFTKKQGELSYNSGDFKAEKPYISQSPNLTNFKVDFSFKPDEYNRCQKEPVARTAMIATFKTVIVVAAFPRNIVGGSQHCVLPGATRLMFAHDFAFGPLRNNIGVPNQMPDDFAEGSSLSKDAPGPSSEMNCDVTEWAKN